MPFRGPLSNDITKQLFTDNWPIRRRWLKVGILTLWANAEIVLGFILFGGGNSLQVQIFIALLGAAMTVFTGYVFAAVWDDNNKRRHWSDSVEEGGNDGDDDLILPTPSAANKDSE